MTETLHPKAKIIIYPATNNQTYISIRSGQNIPDVSVHADQFIRTMGCNVCPLKDTSCIPAPTTPPLHRHIPSNLHARAICISRHLDQSNAS